MRYLPHTDDEIAAMLKVVGVESLDGLFSNIPDKCRRRNAMSLPDPMTEWELNAYMAALSRNTAASPDYTLYIGAGSYEHHIPATVPYLLSRSEFVTSYTPYQPEMSQGTLQAIYEYQTLITRLLGLEVANASLYDGASALAEAILMAARITRRRKAAISSLVHPHYRQVVETYLEPSGIEIIELPRLDNGITDLSPLEGMDDLAAVAVQSPNFFGCIERLQVLEEKAHGKGALLVTAFTEPLSFGLLKSPGSLGADIACGEGQSLGIPRSFGGPALGVFACKMKYVRNLPGRLVGETTDRDGKRGFVLTLATREQHIRREKATSNICTNNSLCALTASVYMASLGGTGFRELARLNYDKAEYLKQELRSAGLKIPFESPTFNEFVVEFPDGFGATHGRLLEKKVLAGLPLSSYYPDLKNHFLICVTETKSKEDMDNFVKEVTS